MKFVGRRKWLAFIIRSQIDDQYFETLTIFNNRWIRCNDPYFEEEGWPPFCMNISSLLIIWDFDKTWNENNTPKYIRDWFNGWNRKQLGAHLFTTRLGKIQMVYVSVDSKSGDIRCSSPHDISAVYPVIRNEEKEGEQSFVLGLFFGSVDTTKNRENGNRLYHKYGYNWLQIDNCWELDERFFEEKFVKHWHKFETQKYFALYVCHSAKLIVQDNCVETNHTRTLVQQGGIIIIEGELSFRVKDIEYFYTFVDCFKDGILVPIDKSRNVKDFQTPVLFLGANDSSNNSISWELTISQKKEDNKKSIFLMFLPEGGRFEAIEEWERGVEEMWARHSYERLYESNVMHSSGEKSYSSVDFKIPDRNLLERILCLKDDRIVNCIHGVKLSNNMINQLSKQNRLPPEFNFRKLSAIKSRIIQTKNFYGLSVPPAYPPIEYKVDNTWQYLYLPNKTFSGSLWRHYKWFEFEKNAPKECCLKYEDGIYRLKKETLFVDEFESIKYNKQLADSQDSERWKLCDGKRIRLGSDGWLYQSTGKIIASYETKYYYRYDGPVPGLTN